jgi:hypothetical protein
MLPEQNCEIGLAGRAKVASTRGDLHGGIVESHPLGTLRARRDHMAGAVDDEQDYSVSRRTSNEETTWGVRSAGAASVGKVAAVDDATAAQPAEFKWRARRDLNPRPLD